MIHRSSNHWHTALTLLMLISLLGTGAAPARAVAPAIRPASQALTLSEDGSALQQPPNFAFKWGSEGSGNGQFSFPRAIAIGPSGHVYVADSENHRIQVFTANGTFVTKWGSYGSGDGQLDVPQGIAVDEAGNVYVSDRNNCRIQKFAADGTFLTQWGQRGQGNGQFSEPRNLAVDGAANVYVADSWNNRIQKFSSNGTFLTKWGSAGSGNGQFNYATGVAVGTAGSVYACDAENHRIQKFTSDGTFVAKWGSQGGGDGQFSRPYSVAVDDAGYVYVVDEWNHRIQKFTANGVFVTLWGEYGSGDGQFNLPHGVAVAANSNVYVVDEWNHRVQVFQQEPTQPSATPTATSAVATATSTPTPTRTAAATTSTPTATRTAAPTTSPPATRAFTPSEDGYGVRQWARFAVEGANHDGQSLLAQSSADDFTRSYLQFDLSSFPAHQGVTTATLRLYKTAGPDAIYPLDVYRIEEEWHENTLGTSEEATPWLWLGDNIASRWVGATNDIWIDVDVTEEVNRVLHGRGTPGDHVNLGLGTEKITLVWGTPALTFGDSEGDAARRPQLVVVYDPNAPWADGGPDQEHEGWTLGDAITLDGGGSRDPNQAAAQLVYSWRFLRLPGASKLTSADISPNSAAGASSPTFTPDAYGHYAIQLTVRDGTALTASDTVSIEVTPSLPDHPRIWLTPERLATLRQRAAASTATWTRLRNTLDAHMSTSYPDLWGQTNFVMAYGLGYQMLRDREPTAARGYCDKAIELMNYMVDHHVDISADSWLYFGDAAAGMAVGYDWCYDRLTAAERTKFINQLNDWVDEAFAMDSPWAYYAVEHRPEVNRYYAHLYGRATIGLATLGDNEPRAQEYVDATSQQNVKEIVPFLNRYGEGGDWSEGWNYMQPTMSHLFLVYEAARSVYGDDPFRDTPFPEDLLAFLIHATLPDLGHGYPEGDLWESTASIGDGHRTVMLLLVNEFGDSAWGEYGQHWLEQTTTSPDWNSTPGRMFSEENFFYDFLWGDPDLPAQPFGALSPTHYAAGGGTLLARGDWSANTPWVSFHSGGFLTDHLHRGHNHFNVWRGEWLAHDANLGASNAYNREPLFHNVVVVNDADQSGYSVGRLLRFEDAGEHVYALGNATPVMWYMDWNAGQPKSVADHYTRDFFYWRPDLLLVFDRVTASQASYSKEWLLNVPAQPTIDGDRITVTGPEGKGKLFCRTLWPQSAHIVSVPLSSINPDAGLQGWQIRVTPPTAQASDVFLHVLTIAGPAATSMPNTARIQASQGNMVGAHVREAAGNRLVLFSGDAGAEPPAGNIVYSFQPTADTLHRLLNLQPGKAYQIAVQTAGGSQTVTVRSGGEFHASPQGVLSFTTTADGHVLPPPQGTYLPLVMR